MPNAPNLPATCPFTFADLTPAERKVLENSPTGTTTKLGKTCPSKRIQTREVRAAFLEWLILHPDAAPYRHRKGLFIHGAFVADRLDLSHSTIAGSLEFHHCRFAKGASFESSTIAAQLELDGSTAIGDEENSAIDVSRAEIGGQLECSGAKLTNPKGNALLAQSATIKGAVFLDKGFQAKGRVSFAGTEIGGLLSCRSAILINPGGDALIAVDVTIKGDVFLDNEFQAEGCVWFCNAEIGGALTCSGAKLTNPEGDALFAEGATIRGSVFLDEGFQAEGRVSLAQAEIGGQLRCRGAILKNPKGDALFASGTTIKSNVDLDEFQAEGCVWFYNAEIGGALTCSGAILKNPKGDALNALDATIKRDVFLDKFQAEGCVSLARADIGGGLDCSGAILQNLGGDALFAVDATVKGDVFLNEGFQAEGCVSLAGADISKYLFMGGSFKNKTEMALSFEHLHVHSDVFFDKTTMVKGTVVLTSARLDANCRFQGHFCCAGRIAVDLSSTVVKGSLTVAPGTQIDGEFRVVDAEINGSLIFKGVKFGANTPGSKTAKSITIEHTVIAKTLELTEWKNERSELGLVSLANSKAAILLDDKSSWPKEKEQGKLKQGKLKLTDFSFDRFGEGEQLAEEMSEAETSAESAAEPTLPAIPADQSEMATDSTMATSGEVGEQNKEKSASRETNRIQIPTAVEDRLEWLELQAENLRMPGDYDQLSKVYARAGKIKEANEVLYRKQQWLATKQKKNRPVWYGITSNVSDNTSPALTTVNLEGLSAPNHIPDAKSNRLVRFIWNFIWHVLRWIVWNFLCDRLAGYGLKRHRVYTSLFVLWVIGGFIYWSLCANGEMQRSLQVSAGNDVPQTQSCAENSTDTSSAKQEYPAFTAAVYSLEMTIPPLSMFQKTYWEPKSWFAWCVVWVHTILGWFLTLLAGAAHTDLLRND